MPRRPDEQHEVAAGVWVAIDVAAAALGVSRKRAYRIAKTERWRTTQGHYPKQYLFDDIRTTYINRKETP